MRLTLRTLLAWLDDTLPSKDVARIGRQLHRSRFAQELSRRIRRVVRQRRLTVPGMGTNTPIDSNIIAAYLDNNLSNDQTSAIESLSLNSDVHLSEIAASHQILSVLEQPIEIETDTYAKMYRLVQGPESRIPSDRWLKQRLDEKTKIKTSQEHQASQIVDQLRSQTKIDGFSRHRNKLIACCLILGLTMLSASQWLNQIGSKAKFEPKKNLQTEQNNIPHIALPSIQPTDPIPPITKEIPDLSIKSQVEPDKALAERVVNKTEEQNEVVKTPKFIDNQNIDITATKKVIEKVGLGILDFKDLIERSKTSIILISENKQGLPESIKDHSKSSWSKLTPKSKSTHGIIRFASAHQETFKSPAGILEIQRGSLIEWPAIGLPILHEGECRFTSTSNWPLTLRMDISENTINLEISPNSELLIARDTKYVTGSDLKSPVNGGGLKIVAIKGDAYLVYKKIKSLIDKTRSVFIESASKEYQKTNNYQIIEPALTIQWPNDPETARNTTEMIIKYTDNDRALPVAIMEAISNKISSVRDLALEIAIWIDRDDILLNSLTDPVDSDLRLSSINALKKIYLNHSEHANRITKKLVEELDLNQETSILLTRILSQENPKPVKAWYQNLVSSLEHPSILIRQLSVMELMKAARRDEMGYKPEEPTKKSIDAWKSWLDMDSGKTP